MRHARAVIACLGTLLLAACADTPKVSGPSTCTVSPSLAVQPARVPATSPYDDLFAQAGAEFGVPAALLRAIGYVETRWEMVEGHEEFQGMAPAFGIMALRGERLRQGAERAGLPVETVRRSPEGNVRAAAALLRAHADAAGLPGEGLEAWKIAVAEYSGIQLAAGRESYVADVYASLAGQRSAPSHAAALFSTDPCVVTPPSPATDYAAAFWHASPNFNNRMAGDGGVVHMVIIHSCEGAYTGCWSWLSNAASQVSAHYVVREDGAEIKQLVREASRAWHIGAIYDSTLNANHAGHLHGVQSNHFTIGVEHAGFASQSTWPVEQIDASARLVCDMTRRWGIPRDRLHIVAHGQLQPHNRTDPGKNWPWADYLARIDRYCAS